MASASFSKPCPFCKQQISQFDIFDHITKYHCTQVSYQTTQNFPLPPGQFPNNFNTTTNPIHQQQTQVYYSSPNSVSGGEFQHSFSTFLSNQSKNQYPMNHQTFHPGSCAIQNPQNCVFHFSQSSSDNSSRVPSSKFTSFYPDFPNGRRLVSLSPPESLPSEPRYTSFNGQNEPPSTQSNIREKIANNLQFDFSIVDTRTTTSPNSNDFSINSNVYETSNNNSSFNFSTSNLLNRQENLTSSSSRNRLQLGEGEVISVEDSDDRNNLSDNRGNSTDSQELHFDFPTENQNTDESSSTSNEPSSMQIEPEMPVLHPSNSNTSLGSIEASFPFPTQSDDDSSELIIPHQPPINDHQMTQPGYNFNFSDQPDHQRVEDPISKTKPHISNDDEGFLPPGFEGLSTG